MDGPATTISNLFIIGWLAKLRAYSFSEHA